MATRTDLTLKPSNSTTALFRAWVQFIEDTLVTTGGWVVTADTGQLVIATAAIPTTTYQKIGYRIYRLDDALQATAPVFLRIDFGSSFPTEGPGVWLTIGQGSNGTGDLTDVRLTAGAPGDPPTVRTSAGIATGTFASYGSADPGRVQLALCASSDARMALVFSLERTKDLDGADTGTGLILYWGTGLALSRAAVVLLAPGGQPATELGLLYILSGANPASFGDVGVGIPIPMVGIAQAPGTGVVVVRTNDFAAGAIFTMTIYGSARTYQHLDGLPAAIGVAGAATVDSTSRIAVRFD